MMMETLFDDETTTSQAKPNSSSLGKKEKAHPLYLDFSHSTASSTAAAQHKKGETVSSCQGEQGK